MCNSILEAKANAFAKIAEESSNDLVEQERIYAAALCVKELNESGILTFSDNDTTLVNSIKRFFKKLEACDDFRIIYVGHCCMVANNVKTDEKLVYLMPVEY